MAADRSYERDDDRYVGEAERVKQVAQTLAAHREAGDELAENDEPNRSVGKLDDWPALDK